MLLSKEVEISWHSTTKKHFQSKGYVFTKNRDRFLVNIEDLTPNSTALLVFSCDFCGETFHLQYRDFINRKSKDLKDRCKLCYGRCNNNKKEFYEKAVVKEFQDRGLLLIENQEYKGNDVPLKFICGIHREIGVQEISLRQLRKRKSNCTCIRHNIELTAYIRQSHALYKWKLDVLEKYNYKCDITGVSKDLEVHHLISFHTIFDSIVYNLNLIHSDKIQDYSDEQLKELENRVIDEHNVNLGVPLRRDIHKLFHRIYSSKNNTTEQYIEFKNRYEKGEFDEIR